MQSALSSHGEPLTAPPGLPVPLPESPESVPLSVAPAVVVDEVVPGVPVVELVVAPPSELPELAPALPVVSAPELTPGGIVDGLVELDDASDVEPSDPDGSSDPPHAMHSTNPLDHNPTRMRRRLAGRSGGGGPLQAPATGVTNDGAMSPITTHVLDTSRGGPAPGIEIHLRRVAEDGTQTDVGHGTTDDDGRVKDLMAEGSLTPGRYRITFATEAYLQRTAGGGFYPQVVVDFVIEAADEHYHVPLLLSPFGYSTYRGS